jgi:hypothetical protein
LVWPIYDIVSYLELELDTVDFTSPNTRGTKQRKFQPFFVLCPLAPREKPNSRTNREFSKPTQTLLDETYKIRTLCEVEPNLRRNQEFETKKIQPDLTKIGATKD